MRNPSWYEDPPEDPPEEVDPEDLNWQPVNHAPFTDGLIDDFDYQAVLDRRHDSK